MLCIQSAILEVSGWHQWTCTESTSSSREVSSACPEERSSLLRYVSAKNFAKSISSTIIGGVVDINKVVADCVVSARAAGPDHPIEIDTHGNDENFVLGDETRIHQAVQNLLANARTHTPAGTQIHISIDSYEDETTISVKDNGPGLAPELQEKIFERFFRADPSRVRIDGEGSGLGLSIVDAVMKAHGGSVTLESEVGKGSTFTLHFPLKD